MSKWTDPDEWRRLVSGESCPVCLDGKPFNTIAELEVSYLAAGEETSIKGSCALFLKRHAVELYELSAEEAAAFMRDAQRASKAFQDVTGAVKMNYEIHGNTIPHLHAHLYARSVGDPFDGTAIDWKRGVHADWRVGEFERFTASLAAALNQTAPSR